MSYLNYKEHNLKYWNSFGWNLIKRYMIGKYQKCQKCNETEIKKLILHHISYSHFPFDKENDLIVLCKKCHIEIHKEDSSKIYTEYSINKGIKQTDIDRLFDLNEIKKDIVEKYNRFCDLCNDKVTQGTIIPIKEIELYRKRKVQNAFENFNRSFNRYELKICYNCLERLNSSKPPLWDLDKVPQLAYALTRNPKTDLNDFKNKNGRKNNSQETL